MSADDLLVVSPLDQAIETEHEGYVQWIKQMVQDSIEQKDIELIMKPLSDSIKISKMSGLGLACGLYLIQKNWDVFEIDDTFEDYVFVVLGLHKHTIERYTTVWSMYDNKTIPDTVAPQIMQQNIKSQIPIAKAIDQGYEIDDAAWSDLAQATDYSEVSRIVRDIKGTEPRKGSLQLWLDRDGSLKVISDGEVYNLGYLDVFSEEQPILKAINRVVNNSGIIRR